MCRVALMCGYWKEQDDGMLMLNYWVGIITVDESILR